jgi:hypothetical protein
MASDHHGLVARTGPTNWRAAPGTTVTGGGMGGGEIHYHDWQIAISALDSTDLRSKVEHEILPMVIQELEDNRRGATRRMSNALQRAQ